MRCGYDQCHAALDYHHTDPTLKVGYKVGKRFITRGRHLVSMKPQVLSDKLYVEKCVLICANCHRETEYLKLDLRHLVPSERPLITTGPLMQRLVVHDGREMMVKDWLVAINLSATNFRKRMRKGMSLEASATTPKSRT